jgi:hypothetical protein
MTWAQRSRRIRTPRKVAAGRRPMPLRAEVARGSRTLGTLAPKGYASGCRRSLPKAFIKTAVLRLSTATEN